MSTLEVVLLISVFAISIGVIALAVLRFGTSTRFALAAGIALFLLAFSVLADRAFPPHVATDIADVSFFLGGIVFFGLAVRFWFRDKPWKEIRQ